MNVQTGLKVCSLLDWLISSQKWCIPFASAFALWITAFIFCSFFFSLNKIHLSTFSALDKLSLRSWAVDQELWTLNLKLRLIY